MHFSSLPVALILLFLHSWNLRADTDMKGEFSNHIEKYSKHYYLSILEVMQQSTIKAAS